MTVKATVAALASAILASCAAAPGPDTLLFHDEEGTPVYGQGFSPTARDGYLLIECTTLEDGRVSDCSVVEERPAWSGSAQMARRIEQETRLRTDSPGFEAGQIIRFPVRLRRDP